ncbi:hypothetical protein DRB06_11470 [Actinomyces sp. Z5]|uniref:hypothetical protein n=1 Tax=Actinomyces sp. Z5 TaxID=2250216 RepID=UPI000DCF4558|nr:hypothetical protein [Actinomyces sp. Z5]RAX19747.1 hypothetical protein DRB06_11470 [Actinomyces sp. Z5]
MTRLSRRTALTTAFAGVLAASLAACSDSEDTQNTGAASQEAGETTAAADADGGSDSTATVPDGYTAVEIPDTTVAFAVPSDWNVLTSDDADDERINAFIQSTGLDEDTVRLKLEAYSVFAASGADSDATEELDVQTDSRTTELRSEEEISADMEEYGLTPDDLSVSTATTGSGAEARLMSYSLEVVEPQYTSMVNALNPDGSGIIVFTVTSTDSAERAQELVDAILGSI